MSLPSKKLVDLRRYAKALGIHVGFSDEDGQHYKKKSVLLHEINEKVNESGDTLRHDWMNRVDTGRTLWRHVFDPLQRHSLIDLHNIARNLGIHPSHRSKGELVAMIQAKTRNEEKEEKEATKKGISTFP